MGSTGAGQARSRAPAPGQAAVLQPGDPVRQVNKSRRGPPGRVATRTVRPVARSLASARSSSSVGSSVRPASQSSRRRTLAPRCARASSSTWCRSAGVSALTRACGPSESPSSSPSATARSAARRRASSRRPGSARVRRSQHRQGLGHRRPLQQGADAEAQRTPGRVDPLRLASNQDLAAVGPLEPGQEPEQGRLAGAPPPTRTCSSPGGSVRSTRSRTSARPLERLTRTARREVARRRPARCQPQAAHRPHSPARADRRHPRYPQAARISRSGRRYQSSRRRALGRAMRGYCLT
jgi:hypothetical protein